MAKQTELAKLLQDRGMEYTRSLSSGQLYRRK